MNDSLSLKKTPPLMVVPHFGTMLQALYAIPSPGHMTIQRDTFSSTAVGSYFG